MHGIVSYIKYNKILLRYPIRGIPKDFKFTKDWADSLTYTKPKSERYVMKIPENGFVNFHMNALSDNFEYASFRVSF